MKVCYIGNYRDGTGYSNQAINNILAIEESDADIVCRPIVLSQSSNSKLASKVEHIEKRNTDNIDVVIQHTLPHMFERKCGVKNIGLFCWETTNFLKSNWPHCCNLMDEIWATCSQNKRAIENSGVKVPVKILPCACDISRFKNKQRTNELGLPNIDNKCLFYTIGEMNRRKNLIGIIRAFYAAFSCRDDVALVIKTSIPGKSPEQTIDIVKRTIEDIRKSVHTYIRTPYYPPIICITDFLDDEKIDDLHRSCDIFVSASHGEAWGIPAHDAMGFGNPTILSKWGSYPELLSDNYKKCFNSESQLFECLDNLPNTDPPEREPGWLIDGSLTPCFGHVDSFPDLYTGHELWFEPNINDLSKHMASAYVAFKTNTLEQKRMLARIRAKSFSYKNVGQIVNKLLETR